MGRRAASTFVAFLALAGVAACDGGEIIVFSAIQAGSAGDGGGGGPGGAAGNAVAGDGPGGAPVTENGGAGASAGGSGGSSGETGSTPCQTTDDCDPTWFCQKRDCSDPRGFCLPRPGSDDPVLAAVCGCDNNNYWNDTLRQQRGISALLATSECGSDVNTCTNDDECGSDASSDASMRCARRLPSVNACGMPGRGQCWVVPNECSSGDERRRFLPCPPPPGAPQPACMTYCEAISSGKPYLAKPPSFTCQ